MTLAAGSRLGPYEIVSPLGAGGMGEVYKAHDTRLNRIVAIKVLSTILAGDQQFRDRFDREARTISQLDHPHICTVYDVGEENGVAYLVMQYLEGDTLEARLKKGRLPLDHVLQHAIEVAEALGAAHRLGIVHRDLKPANVILTKGGVKLLDFGLARARPGGSVAGMSQAATMTSPLTGQGTILGTLHYMSPEQVEGQDADARSDIFSLGVLVYEMVTGKRAFEGQSAASVMAAILEREPPAMSSLQSLASPALDHVVRRCLAKDPRQRWQSATDIVHELRWIIETGPTATVRRSAQPQRRPWILTAASALGLLAATAVSVVHFREAPAPRQVLRYAIPLPKQGESEGLYFASHLSPDGRLVAVNGVLEAMAGTFVREIDSWEFRLLPGTRAGNFFWSPDSRYIAFFDARKLKRVPVAGGPAEDICEVGFDNGVGSWGMDDVILFGSTGGPLFQVPAAGGRPRPVTTPGKGVDHLYPAFLPDSRHFLYTQLGSSPGIYAASVDNPVGRRLLADESSARFAPAISGSGDGHLIFIREGRLMAQRLEPEAIQLSGDAFVLAEEALWNDDLSAAVSVSKTGVLAYLGGRNRERDSRLAWFDRSGRILGTEGDKGPAAAAALSPDEKTAAIPRRRSGGLTTDLWLRDLRRGSETRTTYEASVDQGANVVWSPDGRRIAFTSMESRLFGGKTDINVRDIDASGQGERLVQSDRRKNLTDWSRNGFLFYTEFDPKTGADLWYVAADTSTGPARPSALLTTMFNESFGQLSPDGRWMAYLSDETGVDEVYIRPFPSGAGKWKVSAGTPSQQPRWNPAGREVFYLTGTAGKYTMMSAPVTMSQLGSGNTSNVEVGVPKRLFEVRANGYRPDLGTFFYSVSRDGQRFLINHVDSTKEPVLNVIVNWDLAFAGK